MNLETRDILDPVLRDLSFLDLVARKTDLYPDKVSQLQMSNKNNHY
jgi:hypothetical protein